MNTTIISVNDNTMDFKVRELTKKLLANRGRMFKAKFTKKDGTMRDMLFTNSVNWNELNGIETTLSGAKMVNTKCRKNCITVCECIADGVFQPRSISLEKVISLELV